MLSKPNRRRRGELNALRFGGMGMLGGSGIGYPAQLANLDFSAALPAGATLTRSSTATYWDGGLIQSAGVDVARVEPWGLLIEKSDTNVLINSAAFGSWTLGTGVSVTSNSTTAPDGTLTADTVTEANASASLGAAQSYAAPASGVLTYSIFIKKNLAPTAFPSIRLRSNTFGVVVNSLTGDVSASADIVGFWEKKSLTSKAFGDYWRVSVSVAYTYDVSRPNLGFDFRPAFGTTYPTPAVAAQGSEIAWGVSTSFYSYIPTAAASVTRSADVLTVPNVLAAASNNAIVFEFNLPRAGAAYADDAVLCNLSDGTRTASLTLGASSSVFRSGNDYTLSIAKAGLSADTVYRAIVQGIDTVGAELWLNGSKLADGGSGAAWLTGTLGASNNAGVCASAVHWRKVEVYRHLSESMAADLSTPDYPSLDLSEFGYFEGVI